MREGIVGEELEAATHALFHLHLQGVVFIVGVVAVIGGVHRAARGSGMYHALRIRESKPWIGECRHAIQEQTTASR